VIAVRSSDPKAVAEAIKGPKGSVVAAKSARGRGIAIAWQKDHGVIVESDDAKLAERLSKKLGTLCVLAIRYRTSLGHGELMVFEGGKCVRKIVATEDGTELAGKRYPFEVDVFDLDEDDDEPAYSIEADEIEELCAKLAIRVDLGQPAVLAVVPG
jgi:hypothetical protein